MQNRLNYISVQYVAEQWENTAQYMVQHGEPKPKDYDVKSLDKKKKTRAPGGFTVLGCVGRSGGH